jgi:anti-sigma B factor antagonist
MAAIHPSPDGFSVSTVPRRDEIVVVPAGELDLVSVDLLEREIDELRSAGFANIVIDLRQLTFIDSQGLRLLIVLRNAAQRDGQTLKLIAGSSDVQRLFVMTATGDLFDWA